MKAFRIISLSFFVFLFIGISGSFGQSFLDQQMKYPVFKKAFLQKDDMLKREFKEKGLVYPAPYIYVRSFKYDSKLEVWVKYNPTDTFTLFKTYNVCALSGQMGRKEFEGDRQVPEGFYYINRFNPTSTYHLALKVNYPNYSDKINSEGKNPGGGIYIHGSCVTVGCIPITDPLIDELYILAAHAKDAGQDFIPVHILPVDFNSQRSVDYLSSISDSYDDNSLKFWLMLKDSYDYFNKVHKLPVILYNGDGSYQVERGREMKSLKKAYSVNELKNLKEDFKTLLN